MDNTSSSNKEESSKGLNLGFILEASIMLSVALVLDITGVILFCFALDDFWITDIIGLTLIGGWMLLRKGHIVITKKAKKTASKALKMSSKTGKKVLKRTGLAFLIEVFPYIGVAPSWIIAVFFELKNN